MPHVLPCAVAACRYSRAHGLIHTIARKRRRARIVSGPSAALLIRFANRSALGTYHNLMPAKLSPSRHLRIGRSKAGLGLFARVAIKKGQFIVRYSGRKIRSEAADELDTRYMFEVNTRWTIDGSNRRNRARYINHSCRPNAEAYFVKHMIKIRAIKNIKPGDEITYHYGRDYFDSFIKAAGCKCRACAKKRAEIRSQRSRRRAKSARSKSARRAKSAR